MCRASARISSSLLLISLAAMLFPEARPDIQRLRHTDFHAESRFGVFPHIEPRHYRAVAPGIGLALFKVERDPYIHLFHNSIYLIAKLVDIEPFEAMKNIAEQRNRTPDRINAAVFSR